MRHQPPIDMKKPKIEKIFSVCSDERSANFNWMGSRQLMRFLIELDWLNVNWAGRGGGGRMKLEANLKLGSQSFPQLGPVQIILLWAQWMNESIMRGLSWWFIISMREVAQFVARISHVQYFSLKISFDTCIFAYFIQNRVMSSG